MQDSPYYLQIATQTPLYSLFDYLPPDNTSREQLKPGMRLWVPFRNKNVVAVLISISETTDVPKNKLRKTASLIDEEPIIPEALLNLALWASRYYHHPVGDVVMSFLPKHCRDGQPAILPIETWWRLTKADNNIDALKRAPKQKALIDYLSPHSTGIAQSQLAEQGFSKAIIENLAQKTLIESFEQELELFKPVNDIMPPLNLNAEQQHALNTIEQHLDAFKCFLLKGVTGSGKTEVYLQAINLVLQHDKQALVLVPEIGLTPQTIKRFRRRFNVPMAVLHSGCTDKERYHAWLAAKSGKVKVIIGTRSAIFTPFLNLGIIVIDESHDISFKQQDGFRYSARDLGVYRANQEGIPMILGTATPSLESAYNVQQGRFQLLELKQRAGDAKPPIYNVIDIRNQHLREGFSDKLIREMATHLAAKNQILIFLNRRGYAPVLMCHQCNWVASCNHCDARFTLHTQPRHLHCHHCDRAAKIPHYCPKCNSDNLLPLGLGTERIEDGLSQFFPNNEVIRIDRDSTSRKGSLDNLLKKIYTGQGQILVGTQMLAKGHHFPNVTLVVILDADSGFFSADFRAAERMAQLILQVGGRSGREQKQGEVIIQTHNPEHPQLVQLLKHGYDSFTELSLQERQAAGLPPCAHLAILRADSIERPLPMQFLQKISASAISLNNNQVDILGPIPAPMEKRAGRYRAQLLLKASSRSSLHSLLSALMPQVAKMRVGNKLRWSLDVDPLEMF